MTFLQKWVRKRDNADDVYIVAEPCRRAHNTAVGPSTRQSARTPWYLPCQPRATNRGSLRSFVSASSSVLMMYLFTLCPVSVSTASRALNKVGSGTTGTGNTRSISPLDSTVFPDDSSNTTACFQRHAGREAFTPQRASASTPRNLPPPPSGLRLDSSIPRHHLSETKISTVVSSKPLPVVLPHTADETLQRSDFEGDGNSFLATEERLTTQSDDDFGQPQHDQWVCRISVSWGACGWREAEGRGKNWFCPGNHCCSKTACKNGMCMGGWCVHKDNALCWIKEDHYGGNRCSCKTHGASCAGNAVCHTMPHPDGGTYCTCAQHFLGNGKTCKSDPCQSNPCSPGSCSLRGDSYTCDCPTNTHELAESQPPACVAKKNPCMNDPCGPPAVVDSCLNFEVDYECICKDGYVSENGMCEKVDWCKDDPCGPPLAVHDCVSLGMGFKCYCQRGYVSQRDDEGLEYCAKDFCAESPCGAPEYVASCTNRVRKRASTDSDEDSEEYPRYSCMCSEVAELKVDPETGEGQCVRADPCKGDPCGPPEAVDQCFVQGLSYGCSCKAGYTAQLTEQSKGPTCVVGDPCILKACGPDEFVDSCTTDGKSYTCHCTDEGFLSLEASGLQICRSRVLCEENCGPTEGVTRCTPSVGTYECVCKEGFLLSYNKGKRSCVAGDPCAVAPCGSTKAVAECRREAYGYSCVCNRGYERRNRPDGTELCAEPQSCVGDPCGPVEAVELCITGKHKFSCKCREPYILKEFNGRQRCAVPDESEGANSTPPLVDGGRTESGEESLGLFAGVAIAGVVLIGSAYAGIKYVRKSRNNAEPDTWDDETFFPDFAMAGAHYASAMSPSEQSGQETAILPSPSVWG